MTMINNNNHNASSKNDSYEVSDKKTVRIRERTESLLAEADAIFDDYEEFLEEKDQLFQEAEMSAEEAAELFENYKDDPIVIDLLNQNKELRELLEEKYDEHPHDEDEDEDDDEQDSDDSDEENNNKVNPNSENNVSEKKKPPKMFI
jgi:hypothetical protein